MRLKKLCSGLVVLAICGMLLAGCSNGPQGNTYHPPSAGQGGVPGTASQGGGASAAAATREGNGEGDLAPNFELELLGGGSVKLSDLRGRPVLLNFFATWCGPCKLEMPDIQAVYESYGEEIHVLCVDLAEEASLVEKFIGDEGYTFPVALDVEGSLAEAYALYAIPQTYILDGDGVIATHIMGMADHAAFTAALDALL